MYLIKYEWIKKSLFQQCEIFLISRDIRDIIKHNSVTNNEIFIRVFLFICYMERTSSTSYLKNIQIKFFLLLIINFLIKANVVFIKFLTF